MIIFVFLLSIFTQSCKKEAVITEIADPKQLQAALARIGAPKQETISLAEFRDRVSTNKLGTLQTLFAPQYNKLGSFALQRNGAVTIMEIATEKVKVVRDSIHTSYIFPIKPASEDALSFQNLTIDQQRDGTIVAFISTYLPTKKWVNEWKTGKFGKFDGIANTVYIDFATTVKVNKAPGIKGISINQNLPIVIANDFCVTTKYYYEYPYMCASGYHWPGESCNLAGEERAGYAIGSYSVAECFSTGGGTGAGGENDNPGGGGGSTMPTPPEGYDPCSSGQVKCSLPTSPAETLIGQLGITDPAQQNFIQNPANLYIVEALLDNLNADSSPENREFLNWAVGYLKENEDINASEVIEMNNIPNSTINLPNLIDTTGLSPYPAFKNIVENLPAFINQNPEVIASLSRYTGFSKAKIIQLMLPGKGPKIELVSNLKDEYGRDLFGQYNKSNKSLKIKKELVMGLDKVQSPKRYRAIGMLLAITTLHEFVHYSRDVNKLVSQININGQMYEAGNIFELSISPTNNYNLIDRNNAIDWARFFNFNIND